MSSAEIAMPGTVAHEALQFLRESTHTRVTTSMLGAGIGRAPRRLPFQLQDALQAGIVSRVEDEFDGWIWSVGPHADVSQSVAPDEEAREVVRVSAMAMPSIFAFADSRKAATFSTSLSDDGRLRIERYGRLICELTPSERAQLMKTATEGVTP